ncbi:MAG: autotransporter outer membrane beta-barrel domain-containing protein [Selenomonadales bacterium]|nr:autotransporter outer membrane beta-barrel domain-containing protein [Selenomonadales bacterium]
MIFHLSCSNLGEVFCVSISYGTTSADSDTNGAGGAQSFKSKSNIWNMGVTVEKSFNNANNGVSFVPYAGLRYMNVNNGEYTDSIGFRHHMKKQNIFMVPVGFKLSKVNKLSSGWTLTPKLDMSYTWNLGDTDSEMTITVPGLAISPTLGYSVMNKGSFTGIIGLEAQYKNCTYGVSFAYQKESHQ